VTVKLLNILNGTFFFFFLQNYTSKATKDFEMRILYAENLTLVLWELWQGVGKYNFLHGKTL
jgi:hypothetical protein